MGAFLVVFSDPPTRDLADLVKRFEHVCIEHLVPIGTDDAFDEGVGPTRQLHPVRGEPRQGFASPIPITRGEAASSI